MSRTDLALFEAPARGRRTYHLVGENSVDSLFVQIGEPVESFELVLFKRTRENFGLFDEYVAVYRSRVLEVKSSETISSSQVFSILPDRVEGECDVQLRPSAPVLWETGATPTDPFAVAAAAPKAAAAFLAASTAA